MLRLEHISKTFHPGTVNEKRALNDLSLHLKEGDFCTVIGGNGAGKSTVLNAIAGVWGIDAGSIVIDGTDITRLSEHQRAKYIGRVFQDPMTGTAANMEILSVIRSMFYVVCNKQENRKHGDGSQSDKYRNRKRGGGRGRKRRARRPAGGSLCFLGWKTS